VSTRVGCEAENQVAVKGGGKSPQDGQGGRGPARLDPGDEGLPGAGALGEPSL
jgi:hypothetical protein